MHVYPCVPWVPWGSISDGTVQPRPASTSWLLRARDRGCRVPIKISSFMRGYLVHVQCMYVLRSSSPTHNLIVAAYIERGDTGKDSMVKRLTAKRDKVGTEHLSGRLQRQDAPSPETDVTAILSRDLFRTVLVRDVMSLALPSLGPLSQGTIRYSNS